MKIAALALALISGAAFAQFPSEVEQDRFPKTVTKGSVLIRDARVITGVKGTLEHTDILVENGKIKQIGKGLKAGNLPVINATGKVVMAGMVDAHSHRASDGTNEGAESITSEVRIGDVLNLSALTAWQALASGHTSALILHGSANCVGGESQIIKYKYGRPNTEAPIKDAPRMIKFALGENVTRKNNVGSTGPQRYPATRLGQEQVFRKGFNDAKQYKKDWDNFRAGRTKTRPRYDLRLQTLSDILDKKVWVQCHSYRSDEMLMMVRLSQEFDFKIGALQHALEAYKIAPELAKAGVGVSIFVDQWSFKLEGYDSIPWNAWICKKAGVNVSINTDGVSGTTALNIEAAKTMRYGGFTEQEAIQTVTINPARELGIDHRVGTIEVGKDADLAIWDGHPLSIYAKCAMTLVEGEVFFERRDAWGVDKTSTTKSVLDAPGSQKPAPMIKKSDRYAIINATVYPVSSPKIEGGTVLVENGKITAVGTSVSIPSGTRVINARGLRVYPGFIDANSNIGLTEIEPISQTSDLSELGTNKAELDTATALWVESAHYDPTRNSGVTNAFTSPEGGIISGRGAFINTRGLTTEELTLARQAALVVNITAGFSGGGDFDICCDSFDMCDLLGGKGHTHDLKSDADLSLNQIEEYFDLLGGRVKPQEPAKELPTGDPNLNRLFDEAMSYFVARKANPDAKYDAKFEAMIPYITRQKVVAIRARRAADIRAAVGFAKKYKLKAVILGASEAWKETALLKESGIPVVIAPAGLATLGANNTDNPWDPYDTPYAKASLLARAGVKFAFGTGAGADGMNLPVRAGQACAYGLSQDDAIRALTLNAAEAFGVADKVGSLEAGKVANLVISDGDPLEMTSTIRYVFVNGQPAPDGK